MEKEEIVIVSIIILVFIAIITIFTYFSSELQADEYYRTNLDTWRDKECESYKPQLLEELNVYYPFGFICSSWLADEKYPSKSQCSCYRGSSAEPEIIRYDRETGEIKYLSIDVKYNDEIMREVVK